MRDPWKWQNINCLLSSGAPPQALRDRVHTVELDCQDWYLLFVLPCHKPWITPVFHKHLFNPLSSSLLHPWFTEMHPHPSEAIRHAFTPPVLASMLRWREEACCSLLGELNDADVENDSLLKSNNTQLARQLSIFYVCLGTLTELHTKFHSETLWFLHINHNKATRHNSSDSVGHCLFSVQTVCCLFNTVCCLRRERRFHMHQSMHQWLHRSDQQITIRWKTH